MTQTKSFQAAQIAANAKKPSTPTQKSETGQKESTPRLLYWTKDQRGDFSVYEFSAGRQYFVADVYGKTPAEQQANAELIVRAVNSHEELLEVCKSIIRLGEGFGQMTHVIAEAWVALKNAEGRQ